jgi:hypothetical protein
LSNLDSRPSSSTPPLVPEKPEEVRLPFLFFRLDREQSCCLICRSSLITTNLLL